MFAYCGNNPVRFIDRSGEDYIWQRLFEDYHFGFIHYAVQMHIILKNPGISMERYVYNSAGKICGRADIVDLATGEIWELKTTKTGATAAKTQVMKYCQKENYMDGSISQLTEGSAGMFPGRFAGSFSLTCMGDNYNVIYYTPEPGVILYVVYVANKTDQKESEPYAVYVPTPQATAEQQSTIGGIPVYANSGLVRAGICIAAAVGVGMLCGGGGGYCINRFLVCGY